MMVRRACLFLLAAWHEWRAARWQRAADAGIAQGERALVRAELHLTEALILRVRAKVASAKAKRAAP